MQARLGERPLFDFVSERAAKHPDALAVVSGVSDIVLTYADLERQVAAWVRHLSSLKITGSPVGLCASASPAVVIGFLAVQRAGGILVPLDPALPVERRQAMADALDCRLILADSTDSDPTNRWAKSLRIDGLPPAAEKSPDQGQPPFDPSAFDPDTVACLYHTSGSTGRPKPVALSHRALSTRIRSMADWFSIGPEEVVCGASSIGFDPFLQQLFFALAFGGTLWLPDRACLLDPTTFWPRALAQGITHLNLVPSQLDALLAGPPAAPPPALRRVVLGGERLLDRHVARIAETLGPVPTYNMYGPTEALVDATGHRVGSADESTGIPVGRPLPGCTIRILDDTFARVPVGAEGELCIGGAGLALGYHGMDGETAKSFVADPFGAPGARLYRTGDRARWRPDGRILFGGRLDDQVKIRGQRLELGEVESVLRALPGVDTAAVVYWPTAPGGPALAAHVVGTANGETLRAELGRRLPAAAVPARILFHDSLPLMTSGKIDRKALPAPDDGAGQEDHAAPTMPRASASAPPVGDAAVLRDAIAGVWADLLGRPVDAEANLFEAGAHSLLIPRAVIAIGSATGRAVTAVDLFRFPSVSALARHLAGGPEPRTAVAGDESGPGNGRRAGSSGIAVVGMAFRFPGAGDRNSFWETLLAGTECTTRFDRDALRAAGAPAALADHPDFVPVHAGIDGVDQFDPVPFGYGRGEAAEIDPQQRLLLGLAWQALEDASCDPGTDGPVGAFMGVGFNAYLLDNLRDRVGTAGDMDRYSVVVAGDKDFAATRLAYKLDLTGPAMTVNSACSTALSATAMAVDSLRLGRCRVALAGAASLGMFSPWGYIHAAGGIASASGRCRPFDAGADGTIGGAGAAVLVLKRLDDALADGDTIHGVIRGVGISNDGSAKAAFAAPCVDGQAKAIAAALADAGVPPDAVGFVEGHGTATPLGDPIEVSALNQVYGGVPRDSILLGSVKGNLGHLDAAAGMAGLIKTLLALRHGVVPPTAHFTTPNPRLPFAEGPFRVNAAPEPWPAAAKGVRLAGVSGFGMGGTNIHMVLQAPPEVSEEARPSDIPAETPPRPCLVTLSASSPAALDTLSAALAERLERADSPPLADVAGSLGRRRAQPLRRAIVATTPAEAATLLRPDPDIPAAAITPADGGVDAALLFPGQGAQHPGMGRDLLPHLPALRVLLDEAEDLLADTPAADVPRLLRADPDDALAAGALAETERTQPALFLVEYAVAEALASFGIRPAALTGHSVGEYVAACRAGVMSFGDALRLVAARGRLMASAPRGAMLAMSMPETDVLPLLAETGADLAAVNAPRQCVAAGTEEQIAALAERVTALGKTARRLAVSHAFHSSLMDPILDAFAKEVGRLTLAPPRIPVLSNLTGDWLSPAMAVDPAYWVRHLRGTVRFADGLKRLADQPRRLLIEAGPGLGLTRLARAGGLAAGRVFGTQPEAARAGKDDGYATLLGTIGALWCAGLAMLPPAPDRRVPLPPYPFDTIRLWIDRRTDDAPAHPAARPNGVPVSEIAHRPKPAASSGQGDGMAGAATAEAITRIWEDVLGVPGIDPHTDFMALGGDSLIAVRVAARLREHLGCEVSADAVFRGATVAGLAALLAPSLCQSIERSQSVKAPAAREEGVL